MKKLFTLAFSALMVLGVASCGSKVPEDSKYTYHAIGNWITERGGNAAWDPYEDNKMTAIAKEDAEALGINFGDRAVKYVYKFDFTIGSASGGWECKAKVNGKVVKLDGKFAVKACTATWDADEGEYVRAYTITNAADSSTGAANAETLTPDTLFMPHYAQEKDADGFCWEDNPVVITGEGNYTLICAKYNAESTKDVVGFGMGVLKR